MNSHPTIEVWDTVGLGLIIRYPTGILISNQTGGYACLHPAIEGIYLPLSNDYMETTKQFLSPEIELMEYFIGDKYQGTGAVKGIDKEDVEKITVILTKYGLHHFIKIDLELLSESHESWIYVNILADKEVALLKNFKFPLKGVLTWANSD